MIELYLNHRDRLINILDMIDGKERSVCAHLSKIGHRNVSPITRKCARARARESVQKKKREPLTPGRESGEVSRRDEKKKKALGRSRWMVFFSRIHEHREIIYGRRIGVLPRIIFEYRPTFVGDATFFFLFFLFSLSLSFFFFRYTDRHTLTADNFIILNNTWRIEGVINRPRRW